MNAVAPLRVGLAGLGTVGVGVFRVLRDNAELITARAGRPIVVTAVSARSADRDRGVDLSSIAFESDARALAARADVDLIVEVIGGTADPALGLVKSALESGKSVVTANKALMAERGGDLASIAAAKGVVLAYEAAIAGGIPIVKTIREGLSGNRILGLHGILNGTCNYILTAMQDTGRAFGDVLSEAQELGYAEADPSFDVDGIDAAHKLALLAALSFNRRVEFNDLYIEGIREIEADDIQYAAELGYRIKLLGIAERKGGDHASMRVHPCLVPVRSKIGSVDGVFNAVVAEADFADQVMAVGRGAGEGPTASAVVADIVDVARGLDVPVFGTHDAASASLKALPMADRQGAYYLRLKVEDRPGVIAEIAAILGRESISIESFLQRGRSETDAVSVVIVTHETDEAAMQRALARIGEMSSVVVRPHLIRIEQLH